MLLILTHENADFDAVASQLAAHKLNPQGVPLLSRRVNRNVQQFLNLYWDSLPFVRPADWRRRRIEEVLLVDTHALSSVRGMVRRPQVRVIDHHMGHKQHEQWVYHVEAVGAATTLLVEMLQTAGLTLTEEEATMMLLGVYEDTGSLTYDTTTARDGRSAAWLIEQGARLNVVRRFMNIALSEAQQTLYNRLQESVRWLQVEGQGVVIASAAAPDDFEEEISAVAHRLRDALAPVALFMLVQIRGDVQIVARSNSDQVDVAVITKALGGGGHSRASAAMMVGQPLSAVLPHVLALLPQAIKPIGLVAQIMSYGLQTIAATAAIHEAATLMQRFGHEGYPVVSPSTNHIVGLLTRRAVDRAVNHGMGHQPVSRIMKVGGFTVRPSDSIDRVQQLMVDEGWGQVPVTDETNSRLIGIVTRTDVLNFLFKRPFPQTPTPDMRQRLLNYLPRPMWGMVLAVSETADSLHMPLYFVGGLVRDLLLGKPPTDLDMVVEGDGIKLAHSLQAQFGGEVHSHARFGTAKWLITPEIWEAVKRKVKSEERGEKSEVVSHSSLLAPRPSLPTSIDFVTARTEFYTEPSALPEVERGSIKLDLHRRDFTINTLALRLDGAHLGELLDFYGGQRDLEQKIIRVLHSLSFIDDPTRMLRAARLEQRLGFHIEERTAELIASALPMLDRATGDRIRHEIELALREAEPAIVLARLQELGVLEQLQPGLRLSPETAESYHCLDTLLQDPLWQTAQTDETKAFACFALWMLPLPTDVQTGTMDRLRVRHTTREDVAASGRAVVVVQGFTAATRPSQVEQALRPFPPRVLLVVQAALQGGEQTGLVTRYYNEWRGVKTAVSGYDLRQLGLKPGPQYAVLLDKLLAAKLDGQVQTEAEEKMLLEQWLTEPS